MGTANNKPSGDFHRLGGRALLLLIVAFLATVLLWRTPAVWPIKFPLVVPHELSHGLAAVLYGGSLVYIEVYPSESGMAFTEGAGTMTVFNAGYLGSLLLGALLLLLAGRAWLDRALMLLLGALVVFTTLRYIPTAASFGYIGGLVAALALAAAAIFLPVRIEVFLCRLLGLASCCYAVIDIVGDVLLGSQMRSDARMLGDLTSVPLPAWCGIWLSLSVGAAVAILWLKLRRKARKS